MKLKIKNNLSKIIQSALLIVVVVGVLCFALVNRGGDTVNAAAGINETINFQGRLLDSTGAVVPDGTYNMEFKIYSGGDGDLGGGDETLEWTETRESGNKVVVKNGYFSVYLGSVTSFGSSVDWNEDTLWLSINIGGTGSPSYDGEMDPFTRLGSTPYALNSKHLGGLESSNFVQLAQGVQTDSSTNSSIFVNKTGASGNILQLQASGTDALVVDNTGDITLGTGTVTSTGDFLLYADGLPDPFIAAYDYLGGGVPVLGLQADITAVISLNDNVSAFQVQNSSFETVFNVDTTNKRAWIGASGGLAPSVLNVTGTISGHSCVFGCWGGYTQGTIDYTSGGVSSFGGFRTQYSVADSTVLTNGYGIFVGGLASVGSGASVTNNYGLQIADQTAGTNDYGISIAGADTQALWVGSGANNTDAANGIAFGSSRDTNLYRSAANTLYTNDAFSADGVISKYSSGNIAARLTSGTNATGILELRRNNITEGTIAADSGDNGIILSSSGTRDIVFNTNGSNRVTVEGDLDGLTFGSSSDTNLYRSAADTLKTDDNFIVAGGNLELQNSGTITFDASTGNKIEWYTGLDYLSGVNSDILWHDVPSSARHEFRINGTRQVAIDSTGITLGSSGDTNLYRSAAATLNTDGRFIVAGSAQIDSGDAANIGLVVKGAASQTADIQQWQNSSSDVLASISATGVATFQNSTDSTTALQVLDADGGDPILNIDSTNERIGIGTASPGNKLHVVGSSSSTTAGEEFLQRIDFTDTGVVTTGQEDTSGLYVNVIRTGATGGTLTTSGITSIVQADTGGASTAYGFYGVGYGADVSAGFYGGSFAIGNDTVTKAVGVIGVVDSFFFGTGTVGEAYGLQGSVSLSTVSTGTYTTAAGLKIDSAAKSGGTIGTNYGIKVDAQTVGDENYGVAIGDASDNTLWVNDTNDSTDEAGGIVFGNSKDTNLYRGAANQLKTDDSLRVEGNANIFQNASDAAATFDIRDASGLSVFTADTSNDRVYIGDSTGDTTGTILVLDTKTDSGDPTGVNGAMYYNSNTNMFRCYENSKWRNCLSEETIQVTQSVSASQNIGAYATNAMNWDTESHKDSLFTHSTSTNNSRIEVGATGRYQIQASVYGKNTGTNRAHIKVYFRINGTTTVKQGATMGYSRGAAWAGGDISATIDTEYDLTSGDYIEIMVEHLSGDGSYTINSQVESEAIVRRVR